MDLSIIVPCRNEGANVQTLATRIIAVMPPQTSYELIFVDDSNDDTPDILERLARTFPVVRYKHRSGERGLSTAILEGFRLAQGDWFVVMDADLQHPPASLPDLLAVIAEKQADVIIPSRFVKHGSDGGLNGWRKVISWSARMIARILLRKVKRIKDPTSGYFAVTRETAFSRPLDPIGWKILLEILVRSDYKEVVEVPYAFEARDQGKSKLNATEQWNYIRHLFRLLKSSEQDLLFWKFGAVGISGVLVNSLLYVLLVKLRVPVGAAYASAALIAMCNNFFWNNRFTWRHIKSDRLWYRIFKFMLVSVSGLFLSSLAVNSAYHWFDAHYLLAGFTGIALSTGWNFLLHSNWTFKKKAEPGMPSTMSD